MVSPIQKLFKKKFVSTLDQGQSPSRGTLDVESGRAGKVTQATGTTMKDASSLGSRARARLVSALETMEEKGTISKEDKALLDRLNALSEKSDKARTTAATKTKADAQSKAKGVSVAGEDGIIKAVPKTKLKDKDMMVGNTTNGITKDGEIIGNPTDNQMKIVIRNMEAREALSAAAKANLARLKRMTKKDRQDAALRNMERKLKDTGADKSGRAFKRGGTARNGHADFRKGGMFYK